MSHYKLTNLHFATVAPAKNGCICILLLPVRACARVGVANNTYDSHTCPLSPPLNQPIYPPTPNPPCPTSMHLHTAKPLQHAELLRIRTLHNAATHYTTLQHAHLLRICFGFFEGLDALQFRELAVKFSKVSSVLFCYSELVEILKSQL